MRLARSYACTINEGHVLMDTRTPTTQVLGDVLLRADVHEPGGPGKIVHCAAAAADQEKQKSVNL